MTDIAIKVENLSKRYRIGLKEEIKDTFVGAIGSVIRNPIKNLQKLQSLSRFNDNDEGSDVLWALKEVSFKVKRGEVIGVIGRNGAGKSTLLKILSKITHPTSGRVELNGRVASLLEVGTGFHPEMTGRENIYLNGTILGMRKKEIDQKLDEIIDFSGVEKFIDTPVKRFSSGMRMRLAFSVAAHLEPEILLIDEVLAVGDVEFQKKCLGKIEEVAGGGRTVLFVSHNMAAISSLTDRTILLFDGGIAYDGDSKNAINQYQNSNNAKISKELNIEGGDVNTGKIFIKNISMKNNQDEKNDFFKMGEDLNVFIEYSDSTLMSVEIVLAVTNILGIRTFTVSNRHNNGIDMKVGKSGIIKCKIQKLMLVEDRYFLSFALFQNGRNIFRIDQVATFDVIGNNIFKSSFVPTARHGVFIQHSEWSVFDGMENDD